MLHTIHLYDAVSLQHFAAAEALGSLELIHASVGPACWTEGVAREVDRAAANGNDWCISIQECVWLGTPLSADDDVATLIAIIGLQGALGDHRRHTGEAESIHIAMSLKAVFVTDDGVAHHFAQQKLGRRYVLDTCDVLADGVHRGIVTAREASDIACAVSDAGRHLRRGRPRHPGHTYFETLAMEIDLDGA